MERMHLVGQIVLKLPF